MDIFGLILAPRDVEAMPRDEISKRSLRTTEFVYMYRMRWEYLCAYIKVIP